jgi:hypothetical protein
VSANNPTNVSGESLPDSFTTAIARADREGKTVSQVQREIAVEALPDEKLPSALREIRAREAEMAKQQADLERAKDAAMRIQNRWHSVRTHRDNVVSELEAAEQIRALLVSSAEDRPMVWDNSYLANHGVSGVLTNFGQIAAAKEALASLDQWLKRKRRDIAVAQKAITDFAQEHGIEE